MHRSAGQEGGAAGAGNVSGRVVVVGSINVDLVVAADHLPAPGETVLGGSFARHFGGKGANQAVAAARAGAIVAMVGAVGDDDLAEPSLDALAGEGVDISSVSRVAAPTGVAIIAVGRGGENQIVVAPGANAMVTLEDLPALLATGEGGVLVTGFEIPPAVAAEALHLARDAGWIAILNPAPAMPLADDLLELGAILVPNEHELCVAAGLEDAARALELLGGRNRGPVVVTRGAGGAILADGDEHRSVAGFPVADVVDTTGAGDAFIGALAAWLAGGRPLMGSVVAANAAGALSVARAGARIAMPSEREILAFLSASDRGIGAVSAPSFEADPDRD